ncbi:hypothetical protein RHODGE_RHODGE_03326 [Rhodoplanes serenus]|uniref:Uncharacterized protein n=1 Tax=Rhodoplanes serenus TaxID=200615 RepID=A0A3S4B638_9BRAD|nr:hypothetical protein [Rhodoplanes serenus]VCU10140.1 hypothetical protein RHODGE_RHODGE_03326 [Rhodoplanes serenus]
MVDYSALYRLSQYQPTYDTPKVDFAGALGDIAGTITRNRQDAQRQANTDRAFAEDTRRDARDFDQRRADAAALAEHRRQSLDLQRQQLNRPTEDVREYEYVRGQGFQGTFADWMQRKRAGAGEYGLQPVWGRDEQGNPVMMQPGKSGEAIRTKLPDGVTLSGKEPIRMDAGTHFVLMDPLTRQVIGQVPKNIEGKEAAEERGKALGQAQVALPGTIAKAEQTTGLIDAMINHPGRTTATGASRWADPRNYIPGTSAKDFAARADQLQGRTFLEAFESLKGGGAITEIEGKKAEAAIARLDRSQSDGEYLAALHELRGIVAAGMERARARAGGPAAASPATPAAPGRAAPPAEGALLAPDGRWYLPDPKRPGKFLLVQ